MPKDQIEWDASPEALAGIENRPTGVKPDFTLTKVRLKQAWENDDSGGQGFILGWETVSAGFGELTIWIEKDGTLRCDTETMGKKFVKTVLDKFAELVCEVV